MGGAAGPWAQDLSVSWSTGEEPSLPLPSQWEVAAMIRQEGREGQVLP